MKAIYQRPKILLDVPSHYCAGCGHGTVHKILAELIEENDWRPRIIGIAPVGCAVLAYNYLDIDMGEAAHGRTPSVATGIKRVHPDKLVFSYQGDGDLAAIGTAEIIHTANRGELITVIFINNAVYGMTGGQMAPTTLIAQKTQTSPRGRDAKLQGYPIKVCELLRNFEGVAYLERTSVTSPKNVKTTRKAIAKAFRAQEEKAGFSLVEILAPCPTYWRLDTMESLKFVDEVMTKTFPLGVYKDWESDGGKADSGG